MRLLEELKWRGLIKDCTDFDALCERLENPITLYCGFDPTAESLHIGHLQQIILLRRYERAGHKIIALCGGATAMIGDPRPTSERKLLTLEDVKRNVKCIKEQLNNFIDFNNENTILANNYDWLSEFDLLTFLRDYGKHFNISYMISKDTIASRLSKGISFTEFTYTILQAIDWLTLYNNYNCELQIGGSDQWGNIISGSDLIHKMHGSDKKLYGVTSSLITKSDGTKFGKSEGENIWLDQGRTSAYDFYQFWININDNDIIPLLKRLSLKSPAEIIELEETVKNEPHLRLAQKSLAEEMTEYVHGKDGVIKAKKITETLFSGNILDLSIEELEQGLAGSIKFNTDNNILLIDVLVNAEIAKSKREARELIQAGSIQVNGVKQMSLDTLILKDDAFDQRFIIIKKGKRKYFVGYFS
ncbi:MAG: tyrosine--tRNA ligase [Anaerorhabdus sp.]